MKHCGAGASKGEGGIQQGFVFDCVSVRADGICWVKAPLLRQETGAVI